MAEINKVSNSAVPGQQQQKLSFLDGEHHQRSNNGVIAAIPNTFGEIGLTPRRTEDAQVFLRSWT